MNRQRNTKKEKQLPQEGIAGKKASSGSIWTYLWEKNISGIDDIFDDDGGEDDDNDDKVNDLDDGVEDLDDIVEDLDDYDEDKPEVQQQSLLPEQPLS